MTLSILEKFFAAIKRDPIRAVEDYHRSNTVTSVKDVEHPWRHVRTGSQVKNGGKWASRKPKNYDVPKVFVSDTGSLAPIFLNESCGAGMHFIVSSPKEGMRLVAFIQSKLVRFVTSKFVYRASLGSPVDVIARLPRALLTSDDPLREVFGLTPEEIERVRQNQADR